VDLSFSKLISPKVVIGLGEGLGVNDRLQRRCLNGCTSIGNQGLTNWLLAMGDKINNSLTYLGLGRINV
jgi:hypothetical protein